MTQSYITNTLNNTNNTFQPSLLLVTISSQTHTIDIKSESDIKDYKLIHDKIFYDLKLKKQVCGLSIDVKIYLDIKDDFMLLIEKEIDSINSTISQVSSALEKSNKDLMQIGEKHYKNIKMESGDVNNNSASEEVMTFMMEYQLLKEKLIELNSTENIVVNEMIWESSFELHSTKNNLTITVPKLNKKITFCLISVISEIVADQAIIRSKPIKIYKTNKGIYTHDIDSIILGTKVFALWKNNKFPYFGTVIEINDKISPKKYKIKYSDGEICVETYDRMEEIKLHMNIRKDNKTFKLMGIENDYECCLLLDDKGISVSLSLLSLRPDDLYKNYVKTK